MAKVIFASDLRHHTDGLKEAEVVALSYRDLVRELTQRFPALTEERIKKYALSIDGMIIQKPMLETFGPDSELLFIARIAGG
jgi:molybdopterin converting factor small subunit